MENRKYIGRTQIGSHIEEDKNGKDIKVIEYASANCELPAPQSVAEAVEFLGEKRALYMIQKTLTIDTANVIRDAVKSVPDYQSGNVEQSAIDKSATTAISGYRRAPRNESPGRRSDRW